MQQLVLDLPLKQDADLYTKDDFVILDENAAAVKFVEKFFEQKNFSSSQFSSLILKGPASSGKTHLLHMVAKGKVVEFLNAHDLGLHNLPHFFFSNHFYILENIEQLSQDLLFHIINAASEARAFLLMSMASGTSFELRDLSSRVKNIFTVEMKEPSYKSSRMLLVNAFSRKQMTLPNRIIDAINNNIENRYEAIKNAVRLIEFYRFEEGKNITVKEVSRIFKK